MERENMRAVLVSFMVLMAGLAGSFPSTWSHLIISNSFTVEIHDNFETLSVGFACFGDEGNAICPSNEVEAAASVWFCDAVPLTVPSWAKYLTVVVVERGTLVGHEACGGAADWGTSGYITNSGAAGGNCYYSVAFPAAHANVPEIVSGQGNVGGCTYAIDYEQSVVVIGPGSDPGNSICPGGGPPCELPAELGPFSGEASGSVDASYCTGHVTFTDSSAEATNTDSDPEGETLEGVDSLVLAASDVAVTGPGGQILKAIVEYALEKGAEAIYERHITGSSNRDIWARTQITCPISWRAWASVENSILQKVTMMAWEDQAVGRVRSGELGTCDYEAGSCNIFVPKEGFVQDVVTRVWNTNLGHAPTTYYWPESLTVTARPHLSVVSKSWFDWLPPATSIFPQGIWDSDEYMAPYPLYYLNYLSTETVSHSCVFKRPEHVCPS